MYLPGHAWPITDDQVHDAVGGDLPIADRCYIRVSLKHAGTGQVMCELLSCSGVTLRVTLNQANRLLHIRTHN